MNTYKVGLYTNQRASQFDAYKRGLTQVVEVTAMTENEAKKIWAHMTGNDKDLRKWNPNKCTYWNSEVIAIKL